MIKFYEKSQREKNSLNVNLKKLDFTQTASEPKKNCSPKASHISSKTHSQFKDSFLKNVTEIELEKKTEAVHTHSEELVPSEAASEHLQSQNLNGCQNWTSWTNLDWLKATL